jgi:hypothetical protein
MPHEWLILHGGALGDLVLTIQLALRLPGLAEAGTLRVVSRTDPGDLSACRPRILRQSSEAFGLHWLFSEQDEPPDSLRRLVRGARVLSALGGVSTYTHRRLAMLKPAALSSIDPQPGEGSARHIIEQWQTQLEAQGLLVPKCSHQHPAQRSLGVPEGLRQRGAALLQGKGVLIHPGSGGRGKCWPLANFVRVARQLREQSRLGVSFLIGEVELETWSPAALGLLAADFPVLRSPPPDDLVAILTAARVLVSNDAGPAHLAALLGTPTVTIFGPTSASVWRPVRRHAVTLTGDPRAEPETWGVQPARVVALVLNCR